MNFLKLKLSQIFERYHIDYHGIEVELFAFVSCVIAAMFVGVTYIVFRILGMIF